VPNLDVKSRAGLGSAARPCSAANLPQKLVRSHQCNKIVEVKPSPLAIYLASSQRPHVSGDVVGFPYMRPGAGYGPALNAFKTRRKNDLA